MHNLILSEVEKDFLVDGLTLLIDDYIRLSEDCEPNEVEIYQRLKEEAEKLQQCIINKQ